MIIKRLKKWFVVCAAAVATHGVWGLDLGGHNRDWWSVDPFMVNEYNIPDWYYIPNDYNSYCVSGYYSEEYGNEYQWLYLPSMLSEDYVDEYGFSNMISYSVVGVRPYSFSGRNSLRLVDASSMSVIGSYAFSNCTSLEEVRLGNNIIDDGAFFGCTSLSVLDLTYVLHIGNSAFSDCTSLEQVDLSHLGSIGDGAFSGCTSLKEVYLNLNGVGGIHSSRNNMGDAVFSGCTSLVDVRIGDGVGAIGSYAFEGCTSLKDINLNNVVSIGSYAFYGCTSLEHLTISGMIDCYYYNNYGYGYQSESVFHGCSVLSNLTITSGIGQDIGILFKDVPITKITLSNDFSFDYYHDEFPLFKSLTQLEVSDDNPYLMVREGMLFDKTGEILYFCLPGLKNVAIPDYVTSIGRFTFRGCSQLESISVGTENLNYKSVNGLLLSKDGKILIRGVNGDVTIPDGVTSISSYAFYGCRGLTSVAIPDSVMSIGASAFEDCSSLTSVTIPDSVTSIGSSAFYGCSSLTSVTIGAGVTDIGIFSDYNSSILEFKVSENNTRYSSKSGLLLSKDGKMILKGVNGIVTIPDGVTSIGASAFEDCSSLTSVTIPDSVTSIGSSAFEDCSSLMSVTIPDSVTSIGSSAFYGCSSLTSVTIGAGVTDIGVFSDYNSSILEFKVSENNTRYSSKSGLLLSKDGKMILKGVNGIVTIPDGVTSIGASAFEDCSSLTSVTISDSVTSIGDYAFRGCSSLVSVTISDSVTSIGDYAFRGCSSLTSVTIPNSVTSIGSSAFYGCCGLRSLTIPFVGSRRGNSGSADSLFGYIFGTSSYDGARSAKQYYSSGSYSYSTYYIPTNLTTVIITDETQLGYGAFYGCDSLASVTIPDSVTSIGDNAFSGCNSKLYDRTTISGVSLVDGWTIDCETSLSGNLNLIGVRGIADYVFYGCDLLTSVTIGDGVTSIGSYAFYNCRSLRSVTIPDSVTSIGNHAFCNCSSLASVTISDSVTSIGDYAFHGCSSLSKVHITDLAKWCDISFRNAYSNPLCYSHDLYLNGERIVNLVIPDGVTNISDYAFSKCSSLTSVTIPDSVTSIGSSAFEDCSSLRSVTIGDSVASIGNYAFYGCNGLKSILIGDGNCNYKSLNGLLLSKDGKTLIQGVNGDVTIPDGVTRISSYAFYGCSGLTSVTIPGSVTSIGDYAFYGCNSKLYDRTTISGVSLVDGWAIDCETSLSGNLNLIGVRGIADYVFYGCDLLTSVTIPDSVTSIGDYAFRGCSSLRSVTIGDSVTSIGDSAFEDCSSLRSVTIGDSVTSIGDFAFYDCRSLTSVTIPASVTSIGDNAFRNCSSLTSVTIPDSVTSIGDNAFSYCRSLESVTIPDSVTSIGGWAFSYCDSLTSVIFMGHVPDGIKSSVILDYATKVHYPEKYATAYEAIVPASRFGGYVNEDGTVGIVSEINYTGLQGATHTNAATYVEGVGIAAFVEPTDINGYTFIGWSPAQIPADATGAQTITAQWQRDELLSPVISAPSFFETPSCTVTISAEEGAAIYYTLDGSMPTVASVRYTAPIILTETATVKAIAVREDYFDSPVASCSVTRRIKTLGECVNSGTFSFTTGGDAEWVRAYGESADGFALRSGDITHSQTSRLDMVVRGSGVITFSYRVEGEIIRNIVFDGLAFCIDGVPQGALIGDSSWTRKSFSVTGPGEHTLSWRYVKDYEGDGVGNDCAWLDCVVWESVAEVIPEVKNDAEVEAVLKESADTKLVENIKDTEEYNAYREWAAKLPNTTPQQVMEAPQAWLSYALDSDTLIAEAPKEEDIKIDEFKPTASSSGGFDLSVAVDGVSIGENAKTENLAKVFGFEGATTLDGAAFSSDNVGIEFGKPEDGKVKIKAAPKDSSAKSFFMRVKVK